MANSHRTKLVVAADYDKPWKVARYIGKYRKCVICSSGSRRRPYSRKATDGRVSKVAVIRFYH